MASVFSYDDYDGGDYDYGYGWEDYYDDRDYYDRRDPEQEPREDPCKRVVTSAGSNESINCCCRSGINLTDNYWSCQFEGRAISSFDDNYIGQGIFDAQLHINDLTPKRWHHMGRGYETTEENNLKEKNLNKYINFNHRALILEWEEDFCVVGDANKSCKKIKSYPSKVTMLLNDNDHLNLSEHVNQRIENYNLYSFCFKTVPFFEGRIKKFLKPKMSKKLNDLERLFKLLEDNLIDPPIIYQPGINNLTEELLSDKDDTSKPYGQTVQDIKNRAKKIKECSNQQVEKYTNCIEGTN